MAQIIKGGTVGTDPLQYRAQLTSQVQEAMSLLINTALEKAQFKQQASRDMYEQRIVPLLDLAGGDPVAAAQINPSIFDQWHSITMGGDRAKQATDMLAGGLTSFAGATSIYCT